MRKVSRWSACHLCTLILYRVGTITAQCRSGSHNEFECTAHRARRVFVYMIDVPPQVNVVRLGFEDAGVAPLPPRFRNFLDETVKALAFCLVINTFSTVTTDASLLVPSSTNDLTNSMWQSGRNLPGVVHRGLHVVLPHV